MIGVHKSLSNDDYHNDTTAVSRSGLWEFRKAPAKYWNTYLNPERPPRKDTPDMLFGRAFHTLVLEPHLFEAQYIVTPEGMDRRTKQGKIDYEDFLSKSIGRASISPDQMRTLHKMRQSVLNHPQASQLIIGGAIEHSIFWQDEHSGVICKTRPDIWHENMTVDLKTCSSSEERAFVASVGSYGYHWQSAMNREGIRSVSGKEIDIHTFICVEKEWPHLVAVYILDKIALESAHNMFKNTLLQFKDCMARNEWPGYETKEISLPPWAL